MAYIYGINTIILTENNVASLLINENRCLRMFLFLTQPYMSIKHLMKKKLFIFLHLYLARRLLAVYSPKTANMTFFRSQIYLLKIPTEKNLKAVPEICVQIRFYRKRHLLPD